MVPAAGVILLVLCLIIGVPLLIVLALFSRTRQLRRDVDDLRERLRAIERPPVQAPVEVPATHVSPMPVSPVHVPPEGEGYRAEQSEAARDRVVERPPQPEVQSGAEIQARDVPRVGREPEVEREHESLESRIGGRWMLNVGIAAIVIGVALFEKLAIERQWIGETARVIQGALFGAALIYAGSRFARRGYAVYGQMLAGGGVAILYVSTYAAFIFYHLIDRPLAFALMVGVTIAGAWLADRHKSQGLAVLAVGGGFLTPFLLHGNTDAQAGLFGYLAIMIGGTVFLSRRHAWPLLNILSYVFTLLVVAAWADRFYAAGKFLRTEIFITVYCAMFVAIARSSRRLESAFAEFAAWFVWTAPAAYYAASLAILGDHPMALLVWLIALAATAGVLSVLVGSAVAMAVWSAAALPMLAWTQPHASETWLRPGLAAIGALYAIALAAQVRTAGEGRPARAPEIAWIHLDALLMFAAAYFILETTRLAATGPLAAAFAAWQGVLAGVFWSRDRDRAVHFAALAFTLLAIAIALQFDGPAVIVGWAAEAAAVSALGLFERRGWMRAGGVLLFAIAIVRTLDLLSAPVPANHVVVLNPRAACALLVIALAYTLAWLHRRDVEAPSRDLAIGTSVVVAQVLSLVLLTSEIHAFFAVHDGAFTRELLVSVTWAVYATILIVVGLARRYAVLRYFGIALFGITIVKVFFSDLAELERIYRVMSVVGLGIALLLTSYLYQRMRTALK